MFPDNPSDGSDDSPVLGGGGEDEEMLKATPEALAEAEELLRAVDRRPRNTSRWNARSIQDETIMRPLTIEDLDQGPFSVEACYEASIIPDKNIRGLSRDIRRAAREALVAGVEGPPEEEILRGMLHHFRTPPVYLLDQNRNARSVYQEMRERMLTGLDVRSQANGSQPYLPIYEGAALVPRDAEEVILAWATWTRSSQPDPQERSVKKDLSLQDVDRLFSPKSADLPDYMASEGINMHAGLEWSTYRERMQRMLLFDTVNAREQGAAGELFHRLYPEWEKAGYDSVLTYRHKILQLMGPQAPLGDPTPRGDNEASAKFFVGRRGFGEIGTRLSNLLAVRQIGSDQPEDKYLVKSIEGWMFGEIEEAQLKSDRLREKQRHG